jgi:8-oxo-dGTP pyrophosphatase MutT (NUDIX family)
MTEFAHLGDRDVHQGHIWKVVVGSFVAPDGRTFTRDVVRSPGSVAVVPLIFDAEGNPSVVLLRQYRPALGREIIEIPAGMRDIPGEPTEVTAHRELAEEVGLAAGRLNLVMDMVPSPGMSDAVTRIYLATDCQAVPTDLKGPEEEFAEILHVPLADAIAMVHSGQINDAKTVLGLYEAERSLR